MNLSARRWSFTRTRWRRSRTTWRAGSRTQSSWLRCRLLNSNSGSTGVIGNLVDVWLTEASERSYEAAFGQLLVIEGHRVIQGPMHHAHEHGKDMIAWDSEGNLCAYQLKGGKRSKLDKAAVDEVQDQLFTAAATAVMHPSLPSPRPPDRVYLVTNQHTTGPAQGRLGQ